MAAGGGGRDLQVLTAVWPLYFTKEEGEFSPYDGRAKVVEVFAQFFRGAGATLVKVGAAVLACRADAGRCRASHESVSVL